MKTKMNKKVREPPAPAAVKKPRIIPPRRSRFAVTMSKAPVNCVRSVGGSCGQQILTTTLTLILDIIILTASQRKNKDKPVVNHTECDAEGSEEGLEKGLEYG